MANTFYASHLAANLTPARTRSEGCVLQPFSYAIVNTNAATNAATVPAINEFIILAKLPKYCTLVGFVMEIPDVGASAVIDVGTLSSQAKFITGLSVVTVPQRLSSFEGAGANTTVNTGGSTNGAFVLGGQLPFQVLNTSALGKTVDDDFRITFTTAITAPVNSTISGFVLYTMDEAYRELPPTT